MKHGQPVWLIEIKLLWVSFVAYNRIYMANKLEWTCKKQLALLVSFASSVCYDELKKERKKASYERSCPFRDHKPSTSQTRSSIF
jgi:hypothetical protein